MPYPTDPDKYPEEFPKLFRQALSKEFSFQAPTQGEATNLVHRLHAYRRAVEEAGIEGWSTLRQITIRQDKTEIFFSRNDELVASMRQALGETQHDPSEAEIEEYLRKMEQGEDA